MDVRPIPGGQTALFREFLDYAFRPEAGPDFDSDVPERPDIFHGRGLYDVSSERPTAPPPETLRAVCGFYDFEMLVRGRALSVAGISAVASPPEWRRQGHVAALLDDVHAELRDEGIAIAALWPFAHGFYRRLGYEITNHYATLSVPPAELESVAGDPAGEFRRMDADDYRLLDEVHRSRATATLSIRRTEGWWRHRVFEGWRSDPYVYGWFDDDGTCRGYVVYGFETDDERTLAVREYAFADEAARAQLFRFLYDHDSQVAAVRLRTRTEPRLLYELSAPQSATTELSAGPMVRIVDAPAALEAVPATGSTGETIAIAVEDDRAPWNDGTFELSAADGTDGPSCDRVDADPDATVSIGALSQLVVGARAATDLRRSGALDADDATVATLDAWWPATTVFLREGF
ncbi:GNAT family N-acetyltransferase [Haloferacaceae archaeon DSL9]